MFKAVVGRPRIDEAGPSKLLDEAKSLELGCVNDADQQRVHFHMPMYGIIEHLKEFKQNKELLSSNTFIHPTSIVVME